MTTDGKRRSGGHILRIKARYEAKLTENGKVCSKCLKDKGFDEYYNDCSRCRDCVREYNQIRQKKKTQALW